MGSSSQYKSRHSRVTHNIEQFVNTCKITSLITWLIILLICLISLKSYKSLTQDDQQYAAVDTSDISISDNVLLEEPERLLANSNILSNNADIVRGNMALLSEPITAAQPYQPDQVQSVHMCPINHMNDDGIFDGSIDRYPQIHFESLSGTIHVYEVEHLTDSNTMRLLLSAYGDNTQYINNYGWRMPDSGIAQLKKLHQLPEKSIACTFTDPLDSEKQYGSYGTVTVHGLSGGNTVQVAYLDCPVPFDIDMFGTIEPVDQPTLLETLPYPQYNKNMADVSRMKLTVTVNTPCSDGVVQATGCWSSQAGQPASLPDKLKVNEVSLDDCSDAATAGGYKYFVFAQNSCFGGKPEAKFSQHGPKFCEAMCFDLDAGLCGYTYAVEKNEYCAEQTKKLNKLNTRDVIETKTLDVDLCMYRDNKKLITSLHKSLYEPLNAHDIETWIDYHSFIGVDRIVIRDRYGSYRDVVQQYGIDGNKYNAQTEVIWRPTPIPAAMQVRQKQLSFTKNVIWAVDQVVLVNADLFRYRASSHWMTAIDVDEYLSVVGSHVFEPICNSVQCTSMLGNMLQSPAMTADGVISLVLYSLYYHNKDAQIPIDPVIQGNQYWIESSPVRFPYRKNEMASHDRIKWIARQQHIQNAFHHRIEFDTSKYKQLTTTGALTVTQPSGPVDCSTHIHLCLRTAHFADSYDARLWPLNKFEKGDNTLDSSLLAIVKYMIVMKPQTGNSDAIATEAVKHHPLRRLDVSIGNNSR